jgi:hypothetical protein
MTLFWSKKARSSLRVMDGGFADRAKRINGMTSRHADGNHLIWQVISLAIVKCFGVASPHNACDNGAATPDLPFRTRCSPLPFITLFWLARSLVMDWIALIVGYFAVVVVGLAVAAIAVSVIAESWELFQERNKQASRELAALDFADNLDAAAYWFSEDEATMRLLQLMASQVRQSRVLGINANAVREEWRKLRAPVEA